MDRNFIKIAEITLSLLKTKKWKSLKLKDVRNKLKIKKTFDEKILKKKDLLININNYFDSLLLKNTQLIENSNSKDMIFETIMLRFDFLQKHRLAILSIFESIKKKPKDLICLFPFFIESMVIMLDIAKIKTNGLIGQVKIKGIFIIYFASFLVWIKDETKSLDKTMTAVDKYLDQAGAIIKYIKK